MFVNDTEQHRSNTKMERETRSVRSALRQNPEQRMAKLVAAIKDGDADKVEQLIGLDTSLSQLLNAPDHYGQTPLHNAVCFGQLETAVLLVRLGAKINIRNTTFDTPLHVACKFGQIRCAAILIHLGGDQNAKGRWGRTPLHYAAAEGQVDCIKLLLKCNVNPMAKTSREADFSNTPLHLAAWFGQVSSIETLLAPNLWPEVMFEQMREKSNLDKNTPLLLGVFTGQLEAVRCLLEKGANIHAKGKHGRRPIHIAAIKGHVDVLHLLLDHGAIITARSGPNFPDFLQTPIHLAATHGQIGSVEALVQRQPKLVNMRCHYFGQTPLHRAALEFQVKTVEILLRLGADVTLTDNLGRTPLMIAKYKKAEIGTFKLAECRRKIVKLLLDHYESLQIQSTTMTCLDDMRVQSSTPNSSIDDDFHAMYTRHKAMSMFPKI